MTLESDLTWWFINNFSWWILACVVTALWLKIRPTRRAKIRLGVALTLYFTGLALLPILGAIFFSLQVGAILAFPMALVSVLRVGEEYDGFQETVGQVIVHKIEKKLAPNEVG